MKTPIETTMKKKSKHPRLSKVVFGTFAILLTFSVLSTPALADRKTGVVKWFNAQKGMGFLTPNDGTPDVMVHKSALTASCNGTLHEGQTVSFDVGTTTGKPYKTDSSGYDGGGNYVTVTNVTCK